MNQDDIVNSDFIPFDIEELTVEELLSQNIFDYILSLDNPAKKVQILALLRVRARELKATKSFNELLKVYQAKQLQLQKEEGSQTIDFTDNPLNGLLCGEWTANDSGIYRYTSKNFTPIKTIACPHPILPIERLINVDTNIEKVKLAFYKDFKWHTVIAEKNTIASKNKILQLANLGIEVNENTAKELITYLFEVINLNADKIPVNKGITHLGWVHDEFVPYTDDYIYDGENSFKSIFDDVKEQGSYDIWKDEIKALRSESKALRFIIASSFASPLIEILQINPFIVHLWGKSGTGKTVALMVAMSIWGNPKVGHLVKNLNSTSVGLERLSAFLHNIPLAGDELQSIKNKFSDFNELIYRLTQGEGRTRGTATGGIEEQLKWRCAFLTTGEEPITTEFSKEGVKNRVIEIEENNKLVEDGNRVVNILCDNYGHAGKEFIARMKNKEFLVDRYKSICQNIKNVVNRHWQANKHNGYYIISR